MRKIKDKEWNRFRNGGFIRFVYKNYGRKFVKYNENLAVHITKSKIQVFLLKHLENYEEEKKIILQDLIDADLIEEVAE